MSRSQSRSASRAPTPSLVPTGPQWQHGVSPQLTSQSRFGGPVGGVAGLVVRWTYSQLNVCGPPALGTRGEVYVLTGSALVALNGADGSVR